MDRQGAWQLRFDFFAHKPVIVEPVEAYLTSDAGLLLFRQYDQQHHLTEDFAAALSDARRGPALKHTYLEMVRSRIYGLLAGYEDQNDHDTLRSDALFKLLADRSPEDDDLASQPTLSRFENSISIASLWRLQDALVEQFIASFDEPPSQLTFDIDCFDDPAHGQQQLVLFHGFYRQYQYLPRVITCADNNRVVMLALLFGTASPSLGADDDLRYLVRRLRDVWPDVKIHLRADSGFAVPLMYETCEDLQLQYSFGIGMNPILQKNSEELLAQAVCRYDQSGQSQRLFTGFDYQAGSWSQERFVIVKAEAHPAGTNRRAIVTNRPGARLFPQAAYDEYVDRGESENRNKELKCGLHADRLSDHRFVANYFRLYLHAWALNLLVAVRRQVADPPPEPAAEVPLEASTDYLRKQYFNRRRQRDPLGEGQVCTWRTRVIKVAAQIVVSTRRICVRLCGVWPHLHHYRDVAQAILSGLSPDTS